MNELTSAERKRLRDEQALARLREKPKAQEAAVVSPPKPKWEPPKAESKEKPKPKAK